MKEHKIKPVLFEPGITKAEVKETTALKNIAPNVVEKCWGNVFARGI